MKNLNGKLEPGKTALKETPDSPPPVDEPTQEQNQEETKSPRRKIPQAVIWAGVGIGAVAASTFGYRWWHYASTHATTDDAYVAGHVHQISSRVPGTVTEVAVNDNQQVNQGQLLVKLDPSDYQTKVQQAQAALTSVQKQANAAQANISLASETAQANTTQAQGDVSDAKTAISTAKAAVAEAQAGLSSAQAQVVQANATLQKAQKDYSRYTTLYQQGAIPRQQLDDAKAAYEVAQAQKTAAEQGVQQAQAKLAQSRQGVASAQAKLSATTSELQQASASGQQTEANRAQYAAAQAQIAQSQAALKDAQLQLSYTNITAPVAGEVGSKTVEVGQRVQPGTPLMAVVGNDYWVTANFKETQLGEIQPGETVEVKLDAFGDRIFTGRVNSISPASGAEFALLPPDNATGNFTKVVQRVPVKITLDPQSIRGYESRIVPGMSAKVSVDLPQ